MIIHRLLSIGMGILMCSYCYFAVNYASVLYHLDDFGSQGANHLEAAAFMLGASIIGGFYFWRWRSIQQVWVIPLMVLIVTLPAAILQSWFLLQQIF